MKKTLLILIALISFSKSYSQYSLNDYKYVIVPKQFHFQTEPDQYRLNQLVKFMFKKVGFETFVVGEISPHDLKTNSCLALKVDVTSKGTFKTKSIITLRDCNEEIIFVSNEGVSREKEYNKTYNLSIRDAFKSFENLSYNYTPNNKYKTEEAIIEKQEIEKLKAEIKELKEINKEIETKSSLQTPKSEAIKRLESFFIAKSTSNGFEILNNKTKLVEYVIYKSNVDNVYLLENNAGIIYKKKGVWMRQYIENKKTVTTILDLRF